MPSVQDVLDAVKAVIDASEEPSDVLFGLNVCLPVESLSDAVGVETVKSLADASIVWLSPLYQRPAQHFFVFFEFETICKCLKVTVDTVTFKEEEVGDRKMKVDMGR